LSSSKQTVNGLPESSVESGVSERLKRFNDVYSLLFVVITILLTVGISTFEKTDLGATITFILGSLAFWVLGHLIGAKPSVRHIEVQLKLIAWLYASLVASDVILKYALGVTDLTDLWSAFCIVASVGSGAALFYYLREGIHRRDRAEFSVILAVLVAALVLYVVYARIVVF
jgi:hypothetical protein